MKQRKLWGDINPDGVRLALYLHTWPTRQVWFALRDSYGYFAYSQLREVQRRFDNHYNRIPF